MERTQYEADLIALIEKMQENQQNWSYEDHCVFRILHRTVIASWHRQLDNLASAMVGWEIPINEYVYNDTLKLIELEKQEAATEK